MAVLLASIVAPLVARIEGQGAPIVGRCGPALTWNALQDRVDIMHALNTSKQVAQPAFLQYTWPDTGHAYGSVSTAVKVALCNTELIRIGPFAEYVWTNQASKRQNTLRAGADVYWQLREVAENKSEGSPILLAQLDYKADREKSTESAQGLAQLTWVQRNRSWPAPNATWRLGRLADVVWSPNLSVLLDHIVHAEKADDRGTVLRGGLQADVSVFPSAVSLNRRLELFSSYAVQRDFIDNTAETDDRHSIFRGGFNFFVYRDDKKAAGISLMRSDGEDPMRGMPKQRYWQLGFTVRVQ
ncbi:MAG: hypothetical protein ACYC3L_10910 [Gemmatimonadaceae bacterium]